jgi:thiol-disulfide isomerase/thioredoxin
LVCVVQSLQNHFTNYASSHNIEQSVEEQETMTAVKSQMLSLGTRAPDFSLPDPEGNVHSLAASNGPCLIMFICNHCPFVHHVREELARLGRDYGESVAIYAINSNDAGTHPGDSAEKMKQEALDWGYSFPYLIDGEQSVAKSFRAACTPDFYVLDATRELVYRGQLDGSRPSNRVPVDGCDVRAALDAVLDGRPVNADQVASIGCNIKWKRGNEPEYY